MPVSAFDGLTARQARFLAAVLEMRRPFAIGVARFMETSIQEVGELANELERRELIKIKRDLGIRRETAYELRDVSATREWLRRHYPLWVRP